MNTPKRKIYLDNNATTPLDERVRQSMLDDLSPQNPSSIHSFGREAKTKLTAARNTIANYLAVKPSEIIFTSGGTEGLNLLLNNRQGHIITSSIEHSAIYETLKEHDDVTYLSPGFWGAPTLTQVESAIQPNTSLVVLSAVNSETGVKLDLESIANLCALRSIPLIIDGVALLGKEQFTIPHGVSAMAFSGHKFHAPKGTGFIFKRTGFKITPIFHGGGQESALRPGTENLTGIIGLAKAVELLHEELPQAELRDYFESELKKYISGLVINGEGPRIANTSNIAFGVRDGESILMNLDLAGIAASHGSACSSGALEPSRVLREMGYKKKRSSASLRFSLSRFTTREEIDETVRCLIQLCSAPVYTDSKARQMQLN